jgi:1-deoxy-D-xylulose-5-phosphate synthase
MSTGSTAGTGAGAGTGAVTGGGTGMGKAAVEAGAGSAVAEALAAAGIVKPILQLGLPDKFIDHGEVPNLLAQCGLDAAGIVTSVKARLQQI